MQRTPAVAANLSPFDMLNDYRFSAGQFSVEFHQVNFSGDDVVSFLQNQSTYDIKLVPPGTFQMISFLDPQGRVECYGWLINENKNFSFLIPKLILEKTLIRLNKFLISEDVTISEPVLTIRHLLIGPDSAAFARTDSLSGKVFDELSFLQTEASSELKTLANNEIETWRGLTGWPSFDGSDYNFSIINNLRLFDLSLAQNKGCYPGQETVSKIATRRGAAYSPVLIELTTKALPGEITSFDKKIGSASACYEWENNFYLSAELLRDFRVENIKIHFTLNGSQFDGVVRYFPLIQGDAESKSRELYYAASDHFKHEELDRAEEKYRLAIKLDPKFGDAYESLGVMLGRLNRYQEAIDLMAQLSEVDPKSVLAHTNMSLFLMKLGKIPEAEEQKAFATVKSFQSFGDEAKNKEVTEQIRKKQQAEWEQRESMFKQVLEIDPEDTLANYGLGSIAVEKGEWQVARTHLEKVLVQDPKYSVAYLALGKALKGLGLKDEAKKIWQEGITVSAAKGDLMPANQMQQELNF